MSGKRVLSIGQCFADHGAITRTLTKLFQADVEEAATASEALDRLRHQRFDLVLVNRILDADHGAGLEVIDQIKSDSSSRDVPVMLVSNYEDAQREAEAHGAWPGFGKASLGQPPMLARVQAAFESLSER